jgi:hypothetical protein
MRTFFAELRSGNTDTLRHVFFDAPDLAEAMQYLRFYCLGHEENNVKWEVQNIGAYKVKGRKYVRLG